jgi:hypothetical protein
LLINNCVGATGQSPLRLLSEMLVLRNMKSNVAAPFRVRKKTQAKACGYILNLQTLLPLPKKHQMYGYAH